MKKRHFLLGILCLCLWAGLSGQAVAQGSGIYGSGLKVNLDTTGSKYIRFIIWNQLWTRYIDNNPNTIVNNETLENNWDIGLRRSRFLAYAQISPRFLIMFHFGINNQSFINGGDAGSNGSAFGANG
ncbi:MAG: porin, partial [Bacteroidia bacterium]|nr:porin [Bacteroidia bacterium]